MSYRQQRGWEKFFTVKQRGICLFVNRFTILIYQILSTFDKYFPFNFTTLSQTAVNSFLRKRLRTCHIHINKSGQNAGKVSKVMNKLPFILAILFIAFCFYINILGLLEIYPLYFTSPLLFFSVFLFMGMLNNKDRFRGFRK